MKFYNFIRFGFIFTGILFAAFLSAQKDSDSDSDSDTDSILRDRAVKLYIDCYRCDIDYIRQEIPYVNYVRDVKEAQVYLLETSQQTGSGGREYTFTFMGQDDFTGMNDTLIYASRPDDTDDHRRMNRTQMIKMGLMRYVAKTPLYSEVNIEPGIEIVEQEVIDRWNNWVFELGSRPGFEGEESLKEFSIRNSVSAVKISHKWKIELDFDQSYTRTKYNFDDTTYIKYRSSRRLDNLIVKSLGEHWAAGVKLDLMSSTFRNIKRGIDFFPSLEYNLFPYSESTHRQMRFLYGFGNSFREYNDSTIYNELEENRLLQKLKIAYRVQEKWGSVNISLTGSNYFHDFSKNNLEMMGIIEIRIIKGLSLMIYGGAARVNDQLSLKKGTTSEADLLLRLQELETAYEIDASLGITYTFGSIYNNVVNPRFGSGSRYYSRGGRR